MEKLGLDDVVADVSSLLLLKKWLKWEKGLTACCTKKREGKRKDRV